VSPSDARRLFDAASLPAQLIEKTELDHLLMRNRKDGLAAIKAYRDRRRRIPVLLIRRLAQAIKEMISA